jgi:heterodisulfide reductase subunit A-like polyferredoxin
MKSTLVGASLIVGAAWVAYNRLREPTSLNSPYAYASTRILIVGRGFGGLAAARELARMLGGSEDVAGPCSTG